MKKSSHSQLLQGSPKPVMVWGLGQGTERRFQVLPQRACVQGTHGKGMHGTFRFRLSTYRPEIYWQLLDRTRSRLPGSLFFWELTPSLKTVSVQFSRSVVSDSATPRIAARQVSLSITNSQSSLKPTSIESVMPSSHLILCHPLFLLPPIPSSIRVFSNESTLCMRWPKYWSFSFSIIPSNEHPGLISFRMDWLDLQESSPTPHFKSINSSVLSFLHNPTLTYIHDYWKNHSLD